jgi:hypothetical protein
MTELIFRLSLSIPLTLNTKKANLGVPENRCDIMAWAWFLVTKQTAIINNILDLLFVFCWEKRKEKMENIMDGEIQKGE